MSSTEPADLRTSASALLGELIGTFLLVLVVGCTTLAQSPEVWRVTAVGLTAGALVYALGSVSGGHLNPAVTLAVGLSGKFNAVFSGWPMAFAYMVTQVLGGIAATFTCSSMYGGELSVGPRTPFSWWEAMVVEGLYTAFVAFVYLSVFSSRSNNPAKDPTNQFYGLAVGFSLIAGGHSACAISGGILNPALALGIEATNFSGEGFVYVAYHMVGAALGFLLFRVTRPEERLDEQEFESYQPKLATRLACEFVGTFAVVLTLLLNIAGQSVATAWATAAALLSATYAVADVSGGHFNPAVTLAAVLSRRSNLTPGRSVPEGIAHMIFQVGAGTLAGLLYAGLNSCKTFALSPKDPHPDKAAYILEFVFTFMLSYTFLGSVCVKGITSSFSRNCHFGLAMGLALFAGLMATLPVSGGVLNPAVAFGVAVPNTINHGHLYYCASFSVVELFGGLVAALVFHITHSKETADRAIFGQDK